MQNYLSLARICHLFNVVCALRIVTFRFASKYHFSFCNAPTFRFAGLICNREGHEEGRGEVFLSRWGVLSLTEHTKFTEVLSARVNSWVSFSLTERAKFTEVLSARINSWGSFSLTEYTDLTEPFCARFEPTEGLRHTEVTEAFQLTLAVTFCDIG